MSKRSSGREAGRQGGGLRAVQRRGRGVCQDRRTAGPFSSFLAREEGASEAELGTPGGLDRHGEL